MDSCFGLNQEELWDQVSIDTKGTGEDRVFISNRIYRQFHLDVRLILYEFSDMPIH